MMFILTELTSGIIENDSSMKKKSRERMVNERQVVFLGTAISWITRNFKVRAHFPNISRFSEEDWAHGTGFGR